MKNHMIPILKIGNYTDATGKKYQITSQILDEIVESYQPYSAPLVKGHPTNEDPAMGWIDKLKIIGDKLFASFIDISEDFKKEIKQNHFKNISASFFLPTAPSNPQQGKYCLRHVGALGAARPAIPNLGKLQTILSFSEENNDVVAFFSEYPYSLRDKIQVFNEQSLINKNQGNRMNTKEQELYIQLQEALSEIIKLKEELKKKQIKKEIDLEIEKIIVDKKISSEMAEQVRIKALKLSEKGINPQESVASFTDFIQDYYQPIYSHRFQDKVPTPEKGIANFSETTSIEESAVFADEVEKFYAEGLSRSDAYKQAKNILSKNSV